ncbi:MAG: hypothetical protein M1828_006291 [Chrysothrix sp. TS-e1954]|nr:MAG: hypothetical protein M1828_006291 [Chrysothrix sp. TS-e1954]
MRSRGSDQARRGRGSFARAAHPGHGTRSRYQGPQNRPFPTFSPHVRPEQLRENEFWRHWIELTVRVNNLPRPTSDSKISTLDLFKLFEKAGNIAKIEIHEDDNGVQTGRADVTFMPPPYRPIWLEQSFGWQMPSGEKIQLQLERLDQKRSFNHRSPVNHNRFYRERLFIKACSLDFCIMVNRDQMMSMRSVTGSADHPIILLLNLLRRELVVYFDINMITPESGQSQSQQYKFQVPLQHVHTIWRRTLQGNQMELILPLEIPPRFFRRHDEIESTHELGSRFWREENAWFRQTDIAYDLGEIRKAPCTLRKRNAEIDIGRWTTYKIVFDEKRFHAGDGFAITEALSDYNVRLLDPGPLRRVERRVFSGWDFIDISTKYHLALDDKESKAVYLPFAVRYQLEVCLSQGCLSEFNITNEFVHRLSRLKEREAVRRLEHVADLGQRFFEPMKMFELYPRPSPWNRLPKHLVLTRTVLITPSTIRFSSPAVETSNRVVRHFLGYADRFLRVRFADEHHCGKLFSSGDNSQDALYTRVKRCLSNGIQVGDRRYRYLAAGNSQFREHGAFFFAPTPDLTIEDIRTWMGNFDHIKSVAKYASRVGQCFSTTRAINSASVTVKRLDDIERNGFNFTDGVGMISRFLAQSIAIELDLPDASEDPPAVFQFRLGGSKGVFAVSPLARGREVHVRPSQEKFLASHQGLEIIRWSSYSPPQLNRQLILVLTALGVSPDTFLMKLRSQLTSLERAMYEPEYAIELLQRKVDPNQTTLNIANMVLDGFMRQNDPFTISVLRLWRAWAVKQLKEKASIDVEKGAFVLGCVDETGILKGHFDIVQEPHDISNDDVLQTLPEIFLKIKRPETGGRHETITGVCILARNPSLHPGDIRVVRAVDVPALHHIYDAVVFPQTGDRDIPGMCSGGDLDGDDFFVSWDPTLIPQEWNHPAMDFTGLKSDEVSQVKEDDITSFFVNYMRSDCLGIVATHHLANADRLIDGVKHPRCTQLAELHSVAVDYPKSGKPASMPRELRSSKFPHFMESRHRPKEQIYQSNKVLGKMYDAVMRIDFDPIYDLEFDERILTAFEPDLKTILDASQLKMQYDSAMRRIMAQHDIATEFEVWSTFCMQHAKLSNDYKFHEELGRLADALRASFRLAAEEAAGGKDFNTIAPFIVAMYRVTAEDTAKLIREHRMSGKSSNLQAHERPLISFPWVFQRELGKIAKGNDGTRRSSKPQPVLSEKVDTDGRAVTVSLASEGIKTPDSVSTTETLNSGDSLVRKAMTSHSDTGSQPLIEFLDDSERGKQSSENQSSAKSMEASIDESIALSAADALQTNVPQAKDAFGQPHYEERQTAYNSLNKSDQHHPRADTKKSNGTCNTSDDNTDFTRCNGARTGSSFEDRQNQTPMLTLLPNQSNTETLSDEGTAVDETDVREVEVDFDDEPSALEKLEAFLAKHSRAP